jgi:hypothetical protein
VLAIVLSGCRTISAPQSVELSLPTLKAFRPPLMPEGLIENPQTSKEVLSNSVIWEFWGYDWQDYALSQEEYIDDIKVKITPPP